MPQKKSAQQNPPSSSNDVRLDAVSRRHAAVLSHVWFNHGLSRSDLHDRTGTRLRTIGSLVEDLISWGLMKEGIPRSVGVGRPQVPLEIASGSRHILGVSFSNRSVIVVKADLKGTTLQTSEILSAKRVDDVVAHAAKLIRTQIDAQTLAIGVGLTGFVDDHAGEWLLSAEHPSKASVSLRPLMKAAVDVPISISNELHAMSAAARLTGRLPGRDSLLIRLEDGRIGASIMVNGKPNRGSVMAANELGHTTMPVKTEKCYCRNVGCIERIFSTPFLRSRGCKGSFADILANGLSSNPEAITMVDLLCRSVANAVNLVRPATLILCSSLYECRAFIREFERGLARHTMSVLHQRLTVEWQTFDPKLNALCATSLPLASLFEEVL